MNSINDMTELFESYEKLLNEKDREIDVLKTIIKKIKIKSFIDLFYETNNYRDKLCIVPYVKCDDDNSSHPTQPYDTDSAICKHKYVFELIDDDYKDCTIDSLTASKESYCKEDDSYTFNNDFLESF